MYDAEGFDLPELQDLPTLEVEAGGASVELDFDPMSAIACREGGSLPATGVRALLLAVLEDGIRCYFSPEARTRNEAEVWVESSQKRTAFSFPVLCELFGIDPGAARRSLRRLRDRLPHAGITPRRRRVVHGGALA